MSVSTSDLPVVASLPDVSIEFATDIADVYPNKTVTLVHSRGQLLPRFDRWMHETSTTPLQLFFFVRSLTGRLYQL